MTRALRRESRRSAKQRELSGVDHALVGGVISRRWGLPTVIAQVIESHHSPEAEGEAAIIRLGDMLAHYLLGSVVAPSEMLAAARAINSQAAISCASSSTSSPLAVASERQRGRSIPCPMSAREVDVLKRLAKGMVYKQIASELGLSTSTVRTHLHNVYGKLGAMDRAQAVLMATERGWI